MDKSLYAKGARQVWMGVRAEDMSRDELIEFIGQMAFFYECLSAHCVLHGAPTVIDMDAIKDMVHLEYVA